MATSEANSWSPLKVSATFNPVCILLSKLLLVGLPIAQISIGTIYLKECTQQNYIPVYVLVSGVFSLCLTLLSCLPFSQKDSPGLNFLCSIWNSLVSGFILCWFIAGSVWIYSIYPANYNSTVVHIPYCNKTLYLFAFWTTTLAYIMLALVFVGGFFFLICMCACQAKLQSQATTQA